MFFADVVARHATAMIASVTNWVAHVILVGIANSAVIAARAAVKNSDKNRALREFVRVVPFATRNANS